MGALVPKPPAGFPFHVGLSVMLAGGVAAFAAENNAPLSPDRLYAGSLGAAIFLLAGPLTEALVAHRYGPRARVDLWRAVQFAAVLLGLATWVQLSPLFERPSYLSGVSSRWEQLEPEHFVVPLGALLAALVVLVGAELRLRRGAQPWTLLDHLPVVAVLPPVDRSQGTSAAQRLGDELWVRRYGGMDSQRPVAVAHTSGSQQSASVRHTPQAPPTQAWLARHDPQRRHAVGIGSSGQSSPARRIDRS